LEISRLDFHLLSEKPSLPFSWIYGSIDLRYTANPLRTDSGLTLILYARDILKTTIPVAWNTEAAKDTNHFLNSKNELAIKYIN